VLQQNVDLVKQSIVQDLHKGQAAIFDGLVANVQPNRLPENLFVSYFLPGFLGTNPNPNWMLEWISIAGSPAAEVSVFDVATQQELFRVPPVLSSRNILLPKAQGDLGDIFKRHEMMAGTLGSAGTNYLFHALEGKSAQAVSSYHNDTNDRWTAILARYGYTPQHKNTQAVASTDDMFDY
jgi:hypothetical protein